MVPTWRCLGCWRGSDLFCPEEPVRSWGCDTFYSVCLLLSLAPLLPWPTERSVEAALPVLRGGQWQLRLWTRDACKHRGFSLVLSLKLVLWICWFCFLGLLCSIRTAIKKYLRYGALIQSRQFQLVEFQMLWQIDGSNILEWRRLACLETSPEIIVFFYAEACCLDARTE